MSNLVEIKNGVGILSSVEEVPYYNFDHNGCECCNSKAGKTLGNDVAVYEHKTDFSSETLTYNLCGECAYSFSYGEEDYDDEPEDNYDYDKYY